MPARSKSQQRLMGMVYAYLDNKLDLDDLNPSLAKKIKEIAEGRRRRSGDKRRKTKGISKEEAKDFASTKHKYLPEKVKESMITKFNDFVNENISSQFKKMFDKEYIVTYNVIDENDKKSSMYKYKILADDIVDAESKFKNLWYNKLHELKTDSSLKILSVDIKSQFDKNIDDKIIHV